MSPQAQTAVILKVATISASLLMLATPAQASDLESTSAVNQKPQRALLLSVGQASQSADHLSQSLQGLGYTGLSIGADEKASSWSLGYRHPVSSRFSIDVHYQQQGNAQPSVKATLPQSKTNAQSAKEIAKAMPHIGEGLSAIALYHHPVGHNLTLQAGIGALGWKSKRSATVGTSTFISESDGFSATVKLGLSYPITRNTRLEGHWQHIAMPDEAVDRVGVEIAVGF